MQEITELSEKGLNILREIQEGYYKKSSVDVWKEKVHQAIKNSEKFLLTSSEVKNKVDVLKQHLYSVVSEINTLPQSILDYNNPQLLEKAHDTFVKETGDLLRIYEKAAESQNNSYVKNAWILSAKIAISKGTNFIKFGSVSTKNLALINMQIMEIRQKLEKLAKKN